MTTTKLPGCSQYVVSWNGSHEWHATKNETVFHAWQNGKLTQRARNALRDMGIEDKEGASEKPTRMFDDGKRTLNEIIQWWES